MADTVASKHASIWQAIFILAFFIAYTTAECNVCQTNRAACINSTSFYLCFGDNQPNTDVLYHCKDGFDCTDLAAICTQSLLQRPPSCGARTQCGRCDVSVNHLFACHSRTTFQMCYGALNPSGPIANCPAGYICDVTKTAICVPPAQGKISCDVVPPPTTTQPPPITPTPSPTTTSTTQNPFPMTPNEVCAQMLEIGLFPTMPQDPFCRRYIYCYRSNGLMQGLEQTCPSGTYYEVEKEQCTYIKPPYCI